MKKIYIGLILGILLIAGAVAGGIAVKDIIINKDLISKSSGKDFTYIEKEFDNGKVNACVYLNSNRINCQIVNSNEVDATEKKIIEGYLRNTHIEFKGLPKLTDTKTGGINLK